MTNVQVLGRGLRGESFADVARRTGVYGILPTDTDAQALAKLNAAAETAAAFAEEFSGPAYASQAAGEAATTEGQFFRVPIGTTPETYTRYQRTSGGSVEAAPLASTVTLAGDTGADLVGVKVPYANARLQTLYETEQREVWLSQFNGFVDDASAVTNAAFENALAALPNGGAIRVPLGNYLMDALTITQRNITIIFEPGCKIYRNIDPVPTDLPKSDPTRAIFQVMNLLEANFRLIGGEFFLQGEGPMRVGEAGLLANTYADQTVAGLKSIAGPPSELLYVLRSSHTYVEDVAVQDTGESCILFRNSAYGHVLRSSFKNAANFGVEFNYPNPADDGGGANPMPEIFGFYTVEDCLFEDIEDWGLGSGNGVGVGGGGQQVNGRIHHHHVRRCEFRRCNRDYHMEFEPGTWVEPSDIQYFSENCGQGSLGLIGARRAHVDIDVFNPGGAAAGAIAAYLRGTSTEENWPELYGMVMSVDFARITGTVRIIDNRLVGIRTGVDGTITAGETTFTASDAAFTAADVGQQIVCEEGGPTDWPIMHARIESVTSSTEVELDRPAPASASAARYYYGGACRRGITAKTGASFSLEGKMDGVGRHSGLTDEPDAAAVYIQNIGDRAKLSGLVLKADGTSAFPNGLLIAGMTAGAVDYRRMHVQGYANALAGVDTFRANTIQPLATANAAQNCTPNAAADTYGDETNLRPQGAGFSGVLVALLSAANVSGETLTMRINIYRFPAAGGASVIDTLEITTSADGQVTLSDLQRRDLHANGAAVKEYGFQVKSTKADSTAVVTPFFEVIQL